VPYNEIIKLSKRRNSMRTKHFKVLLPVLLAAMMLAAFAACGGGNGGTVTYAVTLTPGNGLRYRGGGGLRRGKGGGRQGL
jgi:hypothetical protein